MLISLVSFAQEGTSSPYSFYGIGDVKFRGTTENRSMAGLSVLPDSIHINLQNPAMLSTLKLTNYAVAATYANTKFESTTQEAKARRTTFDYLAVGIPVGKMGFSLGLIPYSSVGYKINAEDVSLNSPSTTKYEASGGINKVFTGMGYQIAKNFSIGADVQYNFGKIETSSTKSLLVELATREKNISTVTGVSFNTGLAYQTKINKKLTLSSGVTYSPQSTLNLSNTRNIATVQTLSSGEFVIEEADVAVANTKLILPSKFSLGSAIGEIRKWNVGAEVIFQNTSKSGNRFNDIEGVSYENGTKFLVGGYFIPKFNSFTSYWNKINYRAGVSYEKTGLVIGNKSIKDQAITLGLGLPVGGAFSNINIGFEYGKRGTIYNGLLRETYANITVGLSFNDKWFRKSKID